MPIIERSKAIHKEVLKSRVWIALHMHAGDGNVHTNIPVNSDDYGMLQEANAAVARIMKFARELNGVISGEHSIGITKLEFLEAAEVQSFVDYKQRVDPEGRFNKGKLMPGGDLRKAYTPSFALIGHESLIMEQSEIGRIADSVKDCLRCGKCKPVCSTHVPRANLLYSPRNKILATSLLVEAFLYEEQTRRGISIKHFDEFSDVADHCTIYHKCLNPCPVDIDFGDVSIAIHEYLLEKGVKLQGVQGVRYMYHDPCHSPMKTYQPMKVVNELMGNGVALNDRCCGESGTLAVTRPDVSTQVRFRKEEEMKKGAGILRDDGFAGEVKILTSCPSCLQGLSRYDNDAGTSADYIVVEMAKHLLGPNWMADYVKKANNGGIERVLL